MKFYLKNSYTLKDKKLFFKLVVRGNINMFNPGQIGLRDGDILEGHGIQSKGNLMKMKGFFPPLTEYASKMQLEDYRDKLNNYNFFRKMEKEERKKWVEENSCDDNELYLQDMDLYIKFLSIGSDFFLKQLGEEKIQMLLQNNEKRKDGYWSIKDVYQMFPRKPGSKAHRHTLVFRPKIWRVKHDHDNNQKKFEGLYLTTETGEVNKGKLVRNKEYKFDIIKPGDLVLKNNKNISDIAIKYKYFEEYNKKPYKMEDLYEVCEEVGCDVGIVKRIEILCGWMTPSLHKSLIQKLIRTRCEVVSSEMFDFENRDPTKGKNYEYFPATEVLCTSFCMLLCSAGSFVPNIQRFVTGMESAFKRLAVSICEDSYYEDYKMIVSLLCGAWLAQNNKEWKPDRSLLIQWMKCGIEGQKSPNMFQYDFRKTTGNIKEWNVYYSAYYLLSNIKSFESDVKMLCSIADNNGKISTVNIDQDIKRVMPFYHCIDQHCLPEIVHYIPYRLVKEIGDYGKVFNKIWNEVTGKNSRKNPDFDYEKGETEFFLATREAQRCLWILHNDIKIEKPILKNGKIKKIKSSLDPGWLSSFIGTSEIKLGKDTAIVMLHPDNPFSKVAVKKPSRGEKGEPELTPDEKERVINIFMKKLQGGVKFKNVPKMLPLFSNSSVRYVNDNYYINIADKWIDWETAFNCIHRFKIHPKENINNIYENGIISAGSGICENSDYLFLNYISNVDEIVLRRLFLYLQYSSDIELYHISRDGTGVDYAVCVEDTGVNELLCFICALYPGLLQKFKSKFKVINGPALWRLFDKIKNKKEKFYESEWALPAAEKRILWDHQNEAIEKLRTTRDNGKRVRLIWIPPGLGKTAIICNYIRNCIQENKMPKYCLYTLPPSAMETVSREFRIMDIPFVHLDMRSSVRGDKTLLPNVVNIIYHDHLRMAPFIKDFSKNMMFIVDEFHKTLNASKRTSVCLEISHLSADVIAMTGTLIKDTHIEPVIKWLEQVVNFEVTSSNYWIAISSIISRKIQTKIGVNRKLIEADFLPDEKNKYYSLVPENLGGNSNSIDFRGAVNISYDAISRKIISLTYEYLNNGSNGVFIVAKNVQHQNQLKLEFEQHGIHDVFLIGTGSSISLTPTDPPLNVPVPKIVISTPQHSEGYNLTRFSVMITGVYFTNQATRDQLEARINRIDSVSKTIDINIVHAGIISYISKNYEHARSLSAALKGFAKEINISPNDLIF